MSSEAIPDGILKPQFSINCPFCQSSNQVEDNSDGKVMQCTGCSKEFKTPNDLTELTEQLSKLREFEQVSRSLKELELLVFSQEKEIKSLKEKGQYEGLLPQNAKNTIEIIQQLKFKLDQALDEIDSLSDLALDESNPSSSNSQ